MPLFESRNGTVHLCDKCQEELPVQGYVDYALRTTVAEPLHDRSSIEAMANWVAELGSGKKARRFFLQPFVDRDTVPVAGLRTPSDEMLESYRNSLLCCAQSVTVRGKST